MSKIFGWGVRKGSLYEKELYTLRQNFKEASENKTAIEELPKTEDNVNKDNEVTDNANNSQTETNTTTQEQTVTQTVVPPTTPSKLSQFGTYTRRGTRGKFKSSVTEIKESVMNDYSDEMNNIKQQAIANGTFMKAPNGKPTNLTERQWLQVRTKAFKRWFGDWEKEYTPPTQYSLSTWERTGEYVDVLEKDFLGNTYSTSKEILSHPVERKEPTKEDPFGFNSKGVSKTIKIGTLVNKENPLNGICQFTAQRIQAFLKDRYNIDAHINIINAKSPVTEKIITHYVVALSIDGKPYIYDMPQTEFISTNGNTFNVGNKEYNEAVITKEYTPRLIAITKESLLKNYGDSNSIQISVIENTAKLSGNIKLSDIEASYIPAYSSNASKVVDENGEPLVVYHTRDSFKGKDFNIFDTTIEGRKSAIYATNDRKMSSSYWKFGNNRKTLENLYTLSLVGDINKIDIDPFTGEPFKNSESYHYTQLIKLLNELDIKIDDTKNTYTQNEIKALYNNLKEQAELEDLKSLFVNIKNPIIIEGNDAYWNKIVFGKEILSTRKIEDKFRNSEYDRIIFKNIKDWGGYDVDNVYAANVYAMYNPNQIKSATDNIGTFSTTDNDIRHSSITEQTAKVASISTFTDRLPISQQAKFATMVGQGDVKISCM